MLLGESRAERVSVPYGIQDSKMGMSQDFVKNPKDSSRSLDLQSSFKVNFLLPIGSISFHVTNLLSIDALNGWQIENELQLLCTCPICPRSVTVVCTYPVFSYHVRNFIARKNVTVA